MRIEKKIKKPYKLKSLFVTIASSSVGLVNGLLGAGGRATI